MHARQETDRPAFSGGFSGGFCLFLPELPGQKTPREGRFSAVAIRASEGAERE